MGYRDENDAMRARLEQLETTNARLASENACLKGETDEGTLLERALGGRLVIRTERTIEGELSEEDRARALDEVRASLGVQGRTMQLGPTTVFRTRRVESGRRGQARCGESFIQVTITPRDGVTKVKIVERRGLLAGLLFGAFGAGIGVGGLALILPLSILAHPLVVLATVPAWIATAFFGIRKIFSAASRSRTATLERAASRIESEVTARIEARDGAPPQVRIATQHDPDAHDLDVQGLDAEPSRARRSGAT